MASMPNTLGLDDDLDPEEALLALEEAFGLKIRNDEAARCETVGDIYDLLQSHFAAQIGTRGACMTSMAFYRLRKALRRMHPDVEFRPSTSLDRYSRSNARKFLAQLGTQSGLRLPGAQGRWLTGIGWLSYVGAVVTLALAAEANYAPIWLSGAASLVVAGVLLMRLDPGKLPDLDSTLGDLATKATALNFGLLARSGAAVRVEGLWDAMADVLSEQGERRLSKTDIRRETFILQKQLESTRH